MSGLTKSAEGVIDTIREYVTAWGVDRLKRGMGVLPEGDKWVTEHEMRKRYVEARARKVHPDMTTQERDEVQEERKSFEVEFGKGLGQCERLGLIERDTAPLSTSIRLS